MARTSTVLLPSSHAAGIARTSCTASAGLKLTVLRDAALLCALLLLVSVGLSRAG